MSSDPKNPGAPPTPEAPAPAMPAAAPQAPVPFAMPGPMAPPMPAQPGFAMPGWPPAMPPAMPPAAPAAFPFAAPQPQYPPQPQYAPQPVMPVAPPPAPAAKPGPVIGTRDEYRFGEEPVAQKAQITLMETPKLASDLPSPTKIDPNFDALKIALEAQMARNAVAPLMYVPPNATRWFRFSPFELFMEQVLARKLWTLE